MGWLYDWRCGRAIKGYAQRLPALLVKDYGAAKAYTPAQIRASILRHGLNLHFQSYAVAMFSDRERFDAVTDRVSGELGELRSPHRIA